MNYEKLSPAHMKIRDEKQVCLAYRLAYCDCVLSTGYMSHTYERLYLAQILSVQLTINPSY